MTQKTTHPKAENFNFLLFFVFSPAKFWKILLFSAVNSVRFWKILTFLAEFCFFLELSARKTCRFLFNSHSKTPAIGF